MIDRRLAPGDEACIETFLAGHAETSMFLRSNMRASGLLFEDAPYHGDWFARLDPDGQVRAVMAHFWNGNLLMQGTVPEDLAGLAAYARREIDRPLAGLIGDAGQVEVLVKALGLTGAERLMDETEDLYSLDLSRLVELPLPPGGRVIQAREVDTSLLHRWCRAYEIETGLSSADDAELDGKVARRVEAMTREDNCWALMMEEEPVCLAGFNARLPDIVQIGPVWTPVERRGQSHARVLVSRCLLQARTHGVEKAILFTHNPAGARAYEAVGFRPVGTYRLLFFRKPVELTV